MHVVSVSPAPFAVSPRVTIWGLPAASDNYTWMLVDSEEKTAVAIDGPEAEVVQGFLKEHGLRLVAVWNTHLHGDHVGFNAGLAAPGVEVCGPEKTPCLTRLVKEGDHLHFGDIIAQVWETPGHVHEHVSFVVPGAVFCGDTLFSGGCGYLFGGDALGMFRSLLRLAALPESTRVCCAHEYTWDNLKFAWSVEPENRPLADRIRVVRRLRAEGKGEVPTTIGLERATNPFLRPGSPPLRSRVAGDAPGEVFAQTRALKDRKAHRDLSDDDLPTS